MIGFRDIGSFARISKRAAVESDLYRFVRVRLLSQNRGIFEVTLKFFLEGGVLQKLYGVVYGVYAVLQGWYMVLSGLLVGFAGSCVCG